MACRILKYSGRKSLGGSGGGGEGLLGGGGVWVDCVELDTVPVERVRLEYALSSERFSSCLRVEALLL